MSKQKPFIALNNYVIVKPIEETKTESGIVLPGGDKDRVKYGLVISVTGSEELPLEDGDQIIYHAQNFIPFNKYGVIILHKNDVIARVPKDEQQE